RAGIVSAGTFEELSAGEQDMLTAGAPLVQERMTLLGEAVGMLGFLFRADEEIEIADDARTQLRDNSLEVLERSIAVLRDLEDFTTDALQTALKQVLVEEMEIKPRFALGPLRTALSGRRASPPLFDPTARLA